MGPSGPLRDKLAAVHTWRAIVNFGDAATGGFNSACSDRDFLVTFAPRTDLGPWLSRFFELRERLAALLGRPVDLVMAGAPANPYFVRSVNASRRVLYAA